MHRSITIAVLALACGALALPLAACNGPHPFVRNGSATGVEIFYSGNVAEALPVAKEHCAQYESVPQYVDASLGIAYFNCIPK
jgi:hypothetical protein